MLLLTKEWDHGRSERNKALSFFLLLFVMTSCLQVHTNWWFTTCLRRWRHKKLWLKLLYGAGAKHCAQHGPHSQTMAGDEYVWISCGSQVNLSTPSSCLILGGIEPKKKTQRGSLTHWSSSPQKTKGQSIVTHQRGQLEAGIPGMRYL